MPTAISEAYVNVSVAAHPGAAFLEARQVVRKLAGLRPTLLDEQDAWLTDPAAHPFYRNATAKYLVARRGSELVGRASIIIDRQHNTLWNCRDAFLGFFEAVDNAEVAGRMLRAAHEWAAANGMTRVLATTNPSANYSCGVQIGGFENAPVSMLDDNPPYYAQLLEDHGYRSDMGWMGYQFRRESAAGNAAKFARFAERASEAGIEFSPLSAGNAKAWRPVVHSLYNDAFRDEWGFVPMGSAEYARYLDTLAPYWHDSCSIIGSCGGDPAGFVCTARTPPGAEGRENPLHVLFLCVAQRYRMRGVAMGLIAAFVNAFAECSSARAEFHSNQDHEFMQKIAAALEATVCRQYSLFTRDLTLS